MTRKKPWNRVNLPVYSISSKVGDKHNMHIITYASQISMQPKRFVCGIYHGTKTIDNVEANGHFVLQLLAAGQYRLVDLLGKKTGHTTDKISRLLKRQLLLQWNDFYILKDCLSVIHLKVVNSFEGGDHKGFICDVLAWQNINDGSPLTLDVLREYKLIRI
jgi:flavin reductase (DIM6/NTAB) family NADH-FMN oxidoreductase RutF